MNRSLAIFPALGVMVMLLSGCLSRQPAVVPPFHSAAYRPEKAGDVAVFVSTGNQMVYVMEGDRPLLVTPVCVGAPNTPTPQGQYWVTKKIEKKRSYSYGYHVNGEKIVPGKSGATPGGWRYVGYPMPYWVEFKPAYGFHSGWVWPQPRTHGCIRLHHNVAPKFFALVQRGTPVHIASTQPWDTLHGQGIARPHDYRDPDPPHRVMISPEVFLPPPDPLFEDDRALVSDPALAEQSEVDEKTS